VIFRLFRPFRWLFNLLRRKNPVYETMTRYPFCGWTVRVWREEPKLTSGPDPEVWQVCDRTFETDNLKPLFVALAKLPRIAAIEVLDPNGNGGLFYPDWR